MIAVTRLRRPLLTGICLALLAAAVGLLVAGHFFSWNDASGFQYERWNYGEGTAAGLFAAIAALLSLFDRTARHLTGAVVIAFVAVLGVLWAAAPHFAFVGTSDGFGLGMWEVLLAMAAFVLLTPRWTRVGDAWERRPGRRRPTTWARWACYTLAFVPGSLVVLAVTSAIATTGHPECGEPGDACMAEYAGWFDGLAVIAAVVAVVTVAEIVAAGLRFRRRRRPG